ncbi:MAG: sigma-54-dependent Fis family transcriptional regulator [Deltaproteobacteria bacterium]|nr:sigma-54-dependent Fis family transcriptional regulator [Deltaproteobacteria bacterium]
MKEGAADFVTKPFELDTLLIKIRQLLERGELEREVARLRDEVAGRQKLGRLIGRSPVMLDLFRTIERVAASAAGVLISGESGTGKELVARALHDLGPRREAPFIAVNCGAIPHELMESELFGHDTSGAPSPAQRSGASVASKRRAAGPCCSTRSVNSSRACRSRCAHHYGHQPQPRAGGRDRALSRRSLLPGERDQHQDPRSARSTRRHPPVGRALPRARQRRARPQTRIRLRGSRSHRAPRVAGERARTRERDRAGRGPV